ncbi:MULTISPECIES: alpha/beta hydrolase family protein [unclassified Streptomyces]|uniref:alpha/beta hydrolase family protein n=1 Tax=unclassified Streptomyces TaxID=2593676 RepID=UPI0037F9BCB4
MAASLTPAPVVSVCAAVLLAGLTLAGCSGEGGRNDAAGKSPDAGAAVRKAEAGPAGQAPPVKGDTFGCLTPEQAASGSIVFKSSSGAATGGFLTGSGNTGIVLAHQADGNVCQWKDKAVELGKTGFRVLAVNSTTGDEVAEIEGAASLLRAEGAWKLLLMGASRGGAATLQAAARIPLEPDAVVALSAPAKDGSLDALGAAPALAAPVLYVAGERDGAAGPAARELSRASARAVENRLDFVQGSDRHGVGLLADPDTWQTVLGFLRKYCT